MLDLPSFLKRSTESLCVSSHDVSVLLAEGWRTWPMETGGILLGRPHANGQVVNHVLGPGPRAVHKRFGFEPDSAWQADQVAAAWHRDPTITYLGDWHTHPDGTTRLSELDRTAAQTIANSPDSHQPSPTMLVLALGKNMSAEAAAARLVRGRWRSVSIRVDLLDTDE